MIYGDEMRVVMMNELMVVESEVVMVALIMID